MDSDGELVLAIVMGLHEGLSPCHACAGNWPSMNSSKSGAKSPRSWSCHPTR